MKDIYVLDFDPGQPLLTLPGCVSLAKVSKPFLTNNIVIPANGVEIITQRFINNCRPEQMLLAYQCLTDELIELFKKVSRPKEG